MNIAVITGASSGMGREFLKRVASEQPVDEIWAIAKEDDKLEELKSEVKVPLKLFACDLTDKKALERIKNELEKTKPNITWLVNASGFGKFGRYDEIPVETSVNMIELNVVALVTLTEYCLPYMEKGARIIEFGSVAAFQPIPYINVYGATKAFVLNYSLALGAELKNRGISVTCICPFWTKTAFFKRAVDPKNQVVTKYAAMYEPQDVMNRAYKDALKRKSVSMFGAYSKFQKFVVDIMPRKWIMNIWIKQQKLDKKYKDK